MRSTSTPQSIIEVNIQPAETVQREQFVKGKIDQLLAFLGRQEKRKIRALHDEAHKLKLTYWRLDRQMYILEEGCPVEGLKKGFKALHSQYGWHLISDWLRNDCARRGGCCGRSCKCCGEKPPVQGRLRGWGHCTTECGCCNRIRGFDLKKEDKKLFQPDFDINKWQTSPYTLSMFMAYMWGLE
jgi:hypothetical protein